MDLLQKLDALGHGRDGIHIQSRILQRNDQAVQMLLVSAERVVNTRDDRHLTGSVLILPQLLQIGFIIARRSKRDLLIEMEKGIFDTLRNRLGRRYKKRFLIDMLTDISRKIAVIVFIAVIQIARNLFQIDTIETIDMILRARSRKNVYRQSFIDKLLDMPPLFGR